MAEEDNTDSKTSQQFVEVICTSSGKTRRFVQGVKAGFALTIINQKLIFGNALPLYIEATKDGKEPIVFSPDSVLRSCGAGWKLHTVVDSQGKGATVEHKKISGDVVTSFCARVESHDCALYVFTPHTRLHMEFVASLEVGIKSHV